MKKLLVLGSLIYSCFAINAQENVFNINDLPNLNTSLGAFYKTELFDEVFEARQEMTLDFQKKTKYGTFITRLNRADRFDVIDHAFEINFYPKITKTNYVLAEYAVAFDKILFPKHRYGLEFFQIFLKKNEISLGVKHLNFNARNVLITTSSLGKYYKKYWFNARVFMTKSNNSTSFYYTSIIRKYLNDNSYVSLNLGYGTYFEEVRQADVFGKSFRAGVSTQFNIFNTLQLFGGFDYSREETLFALGNFISRYSFIIGLRKSFYTNKRKVTYF